MSQTPKAGRNLKSLIPHESNSSLILGVIGGVLLLLWTGSNGYRESLLVLGCSYALVALGMYVPFVLAGTLSMAYSSYAAIGGFAVAIMVVKAGGPLWLGWLVGPPISAVVAVILGWATRRLSGFFLVAVTLLFAEAFLTWVQSTSLTGGEEGFGNLPNLSLFGWTPSVVGFGICAVGLVCLIAYLIDRLRLSSWGVIVRIMREVPQAAEAVGVRVPTMQLVALALGGAVGSLGGSLFVSSVHSINSLTFTLDLVFIVVFMPIVGGIGTAWGSVLGAAIVTDLTLNVTALGQGGLLLVSVGVLIVLLIAPKGVAGYFDTGRKFVTHLIARMGGSSDG
jgi:branched-chain amino acid transport system permease protein